MESPEVLLSEIIFILKYALQKRQVTSLANCDCTRPTDSTDGPQTSPGETRTRLRCWFHRCAVSLRSDTRTRADTHSGVAHAAMPEFKGLTFYAGDFNSFCSLVRPGPAVCLGRARSHPTALALPSVAVF